MEKTRFISALFLQSRFENSLQSFFFLLILSFFFSSLDAIRDSIPVVPDVENLIIVGIVATPPELYVASPANSVGRRSDFVEVVVEESVDLGFNNDTVRLPRGRWLLFTSIAGFTTFRLSQDCQIQHFFVSNDIAR